jgi:hypothetical protein
MHPPFGFALFYLRSVAPAKAYNDKVTGRVTAPVTTGQIYWGAVPFVVIQVLMVSIVIAFPKLVTGNLEKLTVDPSKVQITLPTPEYEQKEIDNPTLPDFGAKDSGKSAAPPPAKDDSGDDLEKMFKSK